MLKPLPRPPRNVRITHRQSNAQEHRGTQASWNPDLSWSSPLYDTLRADCRKQRSRRRWLDAAAPTATVVLAFVAMLVLLRLSETAMGAVRTKPPTRLLARTHAPSIGDALLAGVARRRLTAPEAAPQGQEPVGGPGAAEEGVCPANMVLVEGSYCPEVEHRCVRWLETEGRYAHFRCAEYARPARCLAPRRPLRFCMDRDEYAAAGSSLPSSNQSWTDAKQACEAQGKRLCQESEWVFACEGEELRPYPYGFSRDASACNADRTDIYREDGQLRDLREGASARPRCVSPFGVHHLAGNLEEWTTSDGSSPPRPAMKGAWWQPSRNHCRAAQTAHDTHYAGTETGFRCCRDAK